MNYLIAGLGNPGPEYELTRHNIGFLVLDRLADLEGATFKTGRHGEIAEVRFKGRHLLLLKPSTYMNLSGKAIAYWLQDQKIQKENLLVVVDDIALPFGNLRMKPRGSAAGHNGLGNIEAVLGGQDYPRLRFGIGNEYPKGGQVDFVLSNFSQAEFDALTARIDRSVEMIKSFCTAGIERTMNTYND